LATGVAVMTPGVAALKAKRLVETDLEARAKEIADLNDVLRQRGAKFAETEADPRERGAFSCATCGGNAPKSGRQSDRAVWGYG
jgi:hypothetical protein